ncbi:palmitoyltransferase ZDHHC22 [Sphaerodactylus townsendi]|uniref:palmitoyltransferase ZDHHC22 n=1 Tax=Sphaerodactylus townsendi TaxID=933632 RepID=UPI002025D1EE|nr:palmitoyltransferase ZDHHC22 [Sphaerodactylus townsendi]XP_048339330.1 palmitoyltransferase ZDHHC22 [Sphaerodactylus townsendi]XP_048339331.1 palmitoyltransferase ZDHHC22 [Sphaerodactylus townsendi]XP_048339332.1 palmitoyltransferase ZDHHC22 [Sphaerodactylus townsendi]
MLVLRFLNVVAPAYFLCISVVTFILQLFLFIPTMFKDPSTTPLFSSALLHGVLFLFLSANALGNYILVIQNSPEDLSKGLNLGSGGEAVANWPNGNRIPGSALPGTHFCRLCARATQKHDHHCFFTGNCIGSRNMRNFLMFCLYTSLACLDSLVTGVAYISAALSTSFTNPLAFLTLLPHSISQFFSGALLSSEMFVILMLYLWLGIGLACAGFCCHQMLLILRGQTRHQVRKGTVARSRTWRKNLQEVFGKRWLLGLLIPVLNVGSDYHRQKEK